MSSCVPHESHWTCMYGSRASVQQSCGYFKHPYRDTSAEVVRSIETWLGCFQFRLVHLSCVLHINRFSCHLLRVFSFEKSRGGRGPNRRERETVAREAVCEWCPACDWRERCNQQFLAPVCSARVALESRPASGIFRAIVMPTYS